VCGGFGRRSSRIKNVPAINIYKRDRRLNRLNTGYAEDLSGLIAMIRNDETENSFDGQTGSNVP